MTCDDIVKSLREECETCSENSVCRNGVNLAGLYCANSDAADLIENQQRHIEALLQANAALRDTVLRRDAQIEKMSEGLAQFAKAVAVEEEQK